MRCGVSTRTASAGSSRRIRSTMPPIGSSTRGIQTSSCLAIGGLCPARVRLILDGVDELLLQLAAAPEETGLFLDFDGVLAPIVARPEDAVAPAETRVELARLVERYALVAVISGRAGDDVRARVGVDGIVC